VLGILRVQPLLPEVSVPTPGGRRQKGIVVYRAQVHAPADTTRLHGVPITTPPRVLLDLAPRLPAARLTRACHEAWIRHGTTPGHVEACIARNPTKKASPSCAARLAPT
jgi:hypothetical protein